MKKDILRLGFSLAIFAVFSCVALAVVYTITDPTIRGLEAKNLVESQKNLFPDADTFTDISGGLKSSDAGVSFDGAWKASRGDTVMGVIIKAKGKSYGGDAVVLAGVGTDRRIIGVRILNLIDTPGLGANALSPTYFVDKSSKTTFPGQFAGKPVSDPFTVKDDVIAISASTITSKAITVIIKAASGAGTLWLEANAAGGK